MNNIFLICIYSSTSVGTVGSQIEIERIFNTVNICTNLRHFQLGMDNFEILIIIYKNWHSGGAHVGSSPSMDKDEHVGGLPSMDRMVFWGLNYGRLWGGKKDELVNF